MTRSVSWAIAALLALVLGACGFQLRGLDASSQRMYPFSSIYVDSSLPVAAEVTTLLKMDSRVTLLPSANKAEAVLKILSENKVKEIETINRSGSANEYRLNYTLTARLLINGEQIGKDIVLRQFRSMTYSDNVILGKGQEEDLLWADMSRNAAQTLLYRLSSNQMVKEAASTAAGVVPPAATKSKAKKNAGSQP